jgi:hypothetical protein
VPPRNGFFMLVSRVGCVYRSALFIGSEVSSSASGFKTEVRRGVVVPVGDGVSVNFGLTVGAITDKVDVTGEAPHVDTSSSALGGFVNSATIRELPLNGRDWLKSALLQSG